MVIIGLIIGGVLVGKDLIASAEIRATVSVYQQLDAAVNTFKTKYNCLPGDCPNASDFGFTPPAGYTTINGDGNGHIDNYLGSPGGQPDLGEPQFLLAELSQAGLAPTLIHRFQLSTAHSSRTVTTPRTMAGGFITCR